MLNFTKAFIEDLVADEVMGVNENIAKECISDIEDVQHKVELSKKFGLSTIRVIPITKENKELAYLLGEENEHLVSVDTLNNEDSLACLSAIDVEVIKSGICDNILLVNAC